MHTPTYRTLNVEFRGPMVTVRLDRPEAGNAISDAMLDDLHRALDAAESAPDCRIVVLRGEAGVFCTGMDLVETAGQGSAGPDTAGPDTAGGESADSDSARRFFGLMKRLTTTPRIVIAEVDGRVSGGGVGFAAASDFVVATERSVFSLPEALWGLLPCCVLPFLIRRVGFQKAYAMTLSTQTVTAAQAREFHLVDELTADPAQVIRRLAFRASRLTETTVRDAKRYFGALHGISTEHEALAVGELGRLLGTEHVRQAIAGFAAHAEFPWNRQR